MNILVVEDEPKAGNYLLNGLQELGHCVSLARDGVDGLHQALETPFDVIVLDVMMPKMDGWEVLRRLRKEADTPVLFLTARDDIADRIKGLELGADDYLIKPFSFAELVARLRTLNRRGPSRDEEQLHIADLHIDVLKRRGDPRRHAHYPDQQRVRPAASVRNAPGPGAVPLADCFAGVGHELRQRHQRGGRRRAAPAPENRRPVPAQADPQRAGHWLPLRYPAMNRGHPYSLTLRLALIFALLAFALLATLGVALYRELERELVRRDDAALISRVDQLRNLLNDSNTLDLIKTKPELFQNMLGNRESVLSIAAPGQQPLLLVNPGNIALPSIQPLAQGSPAHVERRTTFARPERHSLLDGGRGHRLRRPGQACKSPAAA